MFSLHIFLSAASACHKQTRVSAIKFCAPYIVRDAFTMLPVTMVVTSLFIVSWETSGLRVLETDALQSHDHHGHGGAEDNGEDFEDEALLQKISSRAAEGGGTDHHNIGAKTGDSGVSGPEETATDTTTTHIVETTAATSTDQQRPQHPRQSPRHPQRPRRPQRPQRTTTTSMSPVTEGTTTIAPNGGATTPPDDRTTTATATATATATTTTATTATDGSVVGSAAVPTPANDRRRRSTKGGTKR